MLADTGINNGTRQARVHTPTKYLNVFRRNHMNRLQNLTLAVAVIIVLGIGIAVGMSTNTPVAAQGKLGGGAGGNARTPLSTPKAST